MASFPIFLGAGGVPPFKQQLPDLFRPGFSRFLLSGGSRLPIGLLNEGREGVADQARAFVFEAEPPNAGVENFSPLTHTRYDAV